MPRQVYNNDGTVWVDHEGVVTKSEKAVCFDIKGEHVWIPRSQIEDFGDEVVGMTPWIAEQKKLGSDW